MTQVQPSEVADTQPDKRRYGRAGVSFQAKLDTTHGRSRCLVLDLSLQGAQIECDKTLEVDDTVWLRLRKLQVFGTVQWTHGKLAGICFDERLPKAIIMDILGEEVDPVELEAAETRLAAQNWVVGDPTGQTKADRLFKVLGAESYGTKTVEETQLFEPPAPPPDAPKPKPERSISRRNILWVALGSALLGLLIGVVSALVA